MSNATDTTSCLSHRPNSRFMMIFEDFLDIAGVSEHQYKLAAFWRVMETKTNDRKKYNEELLENARKKGLPEPETSLWIEISYSQFVDRALKLYKESAFQIAAAESERLGFSQSRVLQRHRDPKDVTSPMEDYKEYLFLADVMQHAINTGELPTPIEINSPLLKSIAVRKERKKQQKEEKKAIENNTPVLKSTGGAIENNTGAIENNTLVILLEESSLKDKSNEGTCTQSATAIASPAPTTCVEKDDEDGRDDTGKHTPDTDSSQQHAAVSVVPGMVTGAEHQSDPAGNAEKPTAQEKRPRTPKVAKSEPVLLSDTKEVQRRINDQRGYRLEEKVDIIRERDAVKQWCALHPLEDFETVIDELINRDKYWSKPENRGRIGGLTLLRETPKVLARLRMTIAPTPEERETITIEGEEMSIAEAKRRGFYSDFDVYVGNGYEERKKFIEEGERLLAAGLLPTDEELGWVPVGAGAGGVG